MFTFFRQLRARLKYRHFDRDLAREIDAHRAMKQRELETAGIPPAEASAATSRALGNVTLMREDARGIWIGRWLRETRQDIRYALTTFRRQPVFTIGAILMLGLGLGLVATVFTFAHASFMRPWRVPDPDTLRLVRTTASMGTDFRMVSMPEYRYLREHATSIRHLAVTVRGGRVEARFEDGVERVGSMTVTANYFEALGIQLVAGRPFLQSEDSAPTPSHVVIISERLWTERFNRTPAIAGQSIRLGQQVMTIVGVAPASFLDGHGSRTEIWRVLQLSEYADPRHADFPYSLLGRLSNGADVNQAALELGQLSRQFRSGQRLPEISFRLPDTRPTGSNDVRQIVGLVLLALVIVQLVACGNVGNLMLARALVRQREIAVRLSLGASRSRVVRQLLTEAMVLSAGAGTLGMAMVIALPSLVVALDPNWGEQPAFYYPTWTTVAVAGLVAVLTAVACGLGPALRVTRVSLSITSGERHGQTLSIAKLSRVLMAGQIALATVLLTSAGLLTRAVSHASAMDPGFDVDALQQVTIPLSPTVSGERRTEMYKQLVDAAGTAGLPPLAASFPAPVSDERYSAFIRPEGSDDVRVVVSKNISANYFEVLGIPLLAGRGPTVQAGDREMVISESIAAMFWPNDSPLGKTLVVGLRSDKSHKSVVVGVAPELSVRSLAGTQPVAYAATEYGVTDLLIRSTNPAAVEQLRALVGALEPTATLTVRPLRDSLADTLIVARVGGWVAWGIGGIGLILATVGAFGVFAHAVEEKRREIGIRMALGAQATQVVSAILKTSQRPVVYGLAAGAALAMGATPLLRSYLYGLSPIDPRALAQVASLLFLAAMIATWVPARRATRVNPIDALRRD
jgi:predicted permease